MLGLALVIAACGVSADAASLLEGIVWVESRGVPYALNLNGGYELVRQPVDGAEALAMARWLLANGHNFDAGIAQVNSANFERLGLSVETAFEPCSNLRAAERVLKDCQARAFQRYGSGDRAEAATLSCYNTGDLTRGLANGYVATVQRARGGAPRPGNGRVEHPERTQGRAAPAEAPEAMPLEARDVFGQGPRT